SDTVPNGTVIRQWSRGYQCGSRLLKPAMVVVSSGPTAAEDTEKKDGE
ncbi:MAG: nucleotide exchange factor GrpE, partial [Lentisphaeria bacterium]|nr:nucleotide exchange factor GrpE [Lentisphaeria bacterium]